MKNNENCGHYRSRRRTARQPFDDAYRPYRVTFDDDDVSYDDTRNDEECDTENCDCGCDCNDSEERSGGNHKKSMHDHIEKIRGRQDKNAKSAPKHERYMLYHSKELLDEVYQNAELGKDILGKLIKICNDSNFKKIMAEEFAVYQEFLLEARAIAATIGCDLKTNRRIKPVIYGSLRLNAYIDKTSSHLAEMLISGTTMGIIDLKRALKEYRFADEATKRLAKRLVRSLQENVHTLLEEV